MATSRNDHEYTKRRDALKRRARTNNEPCAICHHDIDYDLDWRSPMAFTADHIKAIANGGHMHGKLQPTHRACNSRKGANKNTKHIAQPITKRNW